VLDRLKGLGIRDQTLICITSDHGEEFNEHGWAQHDAQLWNESLHVPLIFAGPGVPRGKVIEGPLENRHLARTLMDLAGISETGAGTSRNLLRPEALREVLEQGAYSMHTRGLWCELETRRMVRLGQSHALRQGPWELISCPNTDQEGSSPIIRLFHTERDPERAWDLSSEEPVRTQRMRDEIEAWIQAGLSIQPPLRPTAAETRNMLEGLGYGGG
jgi:arylsulfatase A-like enzyme